MTTRPASAFEHPAIFFVNRLGDQLIALPTVRALAEIFPQGIQILLGEGNFSFFYRGLPVGEPVRVWWADYAMGAIDVDRTARSAAPCDVFVCLAGRISGKVLPGVDELARRMGASWSVGFLDVFDHQVRVDAPHMFDQLFGIAQYFAPSLVFDRFCDPPVFSRAAEAAAVREVSMSRGSADRLLFVHPETHPEKSWPKDRLAWVLERFLAERPDYSAIVSSLAPIDLGVLGGRARRIDTHLELTLAMMRHIDLFLGVDSCFLHAADLFRIPGVALFGPTEPRQWGFRLSPHARHVAGESMDGVRPESVLDALLELASEVDGTRR